MFISSSQPTYLPWPGYFGLIQFCEIFIILDDVQLSRRSWQQRNKIKSPQGELYLSLSVYKKGLRYQKINETILSNPQVELKNHKQSIIHNYRNSEYFKKYEQIILEVFDKPFTSLFELNFKFIKIFVKLLEINTKFVLSSSLKKQGKKQELIFSLLDNFEKKKYIINNGARNYMNNTNVNYDLYLYNYDHTIKYNQRFENFYPFISVLDMIFNIGSENTKNHIINCSSIKKIN